MNNKPHTPQIEKEFPLAQIASGTADLKLAVYIVASLVLMGSLPFNPGKGSLADDGKADPLLYAIDDVRTAIREAMPVMDMSELNSLHNADRVKRP